LSTTERPPSVPPAGPAVPPVPAATRRFHDESLVFLGYTVTPIRVTRGGADLGHMARRLPGTRVDLPKLKEGGVDAVFLSAGIESISTGEPKGSVWATEPLPERRRSRSIFTGPAEVKRVLWSIDALHRMIAANDDVIEVALTAADVERIAARGKIAGILHLTHGAIDDDLAVLRAYHGLGVRAIQLAYDDGTPAWIDACESPPEAGGLTAFGREVIAEMNRLGMLVDLAHASDGAYDAVLDVSTQPVFSSHSAARALCNVRRNLTDDTLRRIAAGGGLLGMFFGSGFLDPHYWDQPAARGFRQGILRRHLELAERYAGDPFGLAEALRAPAPPPDALAATVATAPLEPLRSSPMSALLAHFDHCVRVMGEDSVCLGSDFGGIDDDGVIGLDEPSKLPNLTVALLDHGYDRPTVRKLLGTNLLRLFRQVAGA
jgi:membrane dipeptidase